MSSLINTKLTWKKCGCLHFSKILLKIMYFILTFTFKSDQKFAWKTWKMVSFCIHFIFFSNFVFWDRFYVFKCQNFLFFLGAEGGGEALSNWWICRHIFRILYNEEIMKMPIFSHLMTIYVWLTRTYLLLLLLHINVQNTGVLYQSPPFSPTVFATVRALTKFVPFFLVSSHLPNKPLQDSYSKSTALIILHFTF